MQLRGLHPDVRAAADWAVRYAESQGVPVTITSGYRTWEEQAKLRERWLAGGSSFPANAPGDSAHNWGLAFDSWVPAPYRNFWDQVRQYVGFRTYPKTDHVHGEYPGWRGVVKGWPRPTEQGWR